MVAVLLHYIEEEMHFCVRCGAFQASYHSNSVNLKDYFCPTGLLFTCHILLLLGVAPAPSWPLHYMLFLYYDSLMIGTVENTVSSL